MAENLWNLQQSLIAPGKFSDEELHHQLLTELESIRCKYKFGEVVKNFQDQDIIFDEGTQLNHMILVLSGKVLHSKARLRGLGLNEVIVEGTGAILGSMAHFLGNKSFTCATASGPVEAVVLSTNHLETAMRESFPFTIYFTNILLRQVMDRIRGNIRTNIQLTETLEELKAAQLQLVETEKLATLGQLVAGIAHELNNPSAAVIRSVDHLSRAIRSIITENGQSDTNSELSQEVFNRGLDLKPMSTRELRMLTDQLSPEVNDRSLARQLVEMGFTDQQSIVKLEEHFGKLDEASAFLATYHQAGKFLKNIHSSAKRVESLVKSLKNYARPHLEEQEWFDLRVGIEETILILQHRLRFVNLNKDYQEIPLICGRPSELNQLWTNLIGNALDAVGTKTDPEISIRCSEQENMLVIEIADNGVGIDPDKIECIFELNFTTKKNGRFGMGLGLPIQKKIVQEHGGTISVRSTPHKRTCFTVNLPIVEESL